MSFSIGDGMNATCYDVRENGWKSANTGMNTTRHDKLIPFSFTIELPAPGSRAYNGILEECRR